MLVLEGVAKRYGETVALDGIAVAMAAGHVHTILGENGSGKSTLVKLLSGMSSPTGAASSSTASRSPLPDPADARGLGIATVFQEVLLAPARSVLDNIFLGYDGLFRRALPRRRAAAKWRSGPWRGSPARCPISTRRPASCRWPSSNSSCSPARWCAIHVS